MVPHLPPELPPDRVLDLNVDRDELYLESFGYKQELKRSFSLFGMIGFAFSVLTWQDRRSLSIQP